MHTNTSVSLLEANRHLEVSCVIEKKLNKNKYKQIKSFFIFSDKVHASILQSSTLQCNGINTIKSAELEKKMGGKHKEKHKQGDTQVPA